MSFSEQLTGVVNELRESMSVRKMCRMLRLDRATLYRWMNGEAEPVWLARVAAIEILKGLKP